MLLATDSSAAPAPVRNSINLQNFGKHKLRERILIVDDEVTVRDLFAECLSPHYECVTSSSARQALDELAAREYALVITDMLMLGLSGVELLRKIVELYKDTAVIMVSGVTHPQRALDAIRLGAFDYLIKPCDLSSLQLTVERALERRALLLGAREYKQDLETRNRELAEQKAELERLQARIVHTEKMASLGQLAAGVAHELNNPVGFIRGNLEILAETFDGLRELLAFYDGVELSANDSARVGALKNKIDYAASLADVNAIVRDCRDGSERISSIVQNLRTFCRLDEAEWKKTDVHEGIESTLRLLSQYYTAENIRLERDYGELPPIDAFAAQLNQVWMNLLVNAAQALGQNGGTVRIETDLENDFARVRVIDSGCGIAPEHLKRIFDPFFTTKPVGEGTGLGLSISFGIVERHNGLIAVETKVNRGTTFTVKLPISHQSQFSIKSA